ncbi:ABC transporter permease [Amycolatopsis sp. PS_44_ISF1]|uniref:ABC transporter permease n=1 Tax=Amycolatopsis sp. PS_44_ISF1 TaxID=2974917 RepID=UPI0028DFA874|nr:ABC transporter permease [Amycolatopsis sp. PS_44_ISF1]MDT8912747.1 ABC transporter permease [Amycolatopsis sp. PS_44_ISF1]
MSAITIIRHSAGNALADLRATYTWKTWTFGWLGRMLAQVTFFTYLGQAVGGGQTGFLVIGNAVMTSVIEVLSVVASTTWERMTGTLVLLAAAPARPLWVFFGRSVQWPISGSGTSLVALFGLGPLFGVHWPVWQIAPVVALVLLNAFATYCFGLFLAALVLNAPGVRNLVSQSAYLLMMAICGVQIPLDRWPAAVGVIARGLPLTHGLAAIRAVAADGAPATVLAELGWTVLTGAAWLAAAYVAFDKFMDRAKRSGAADHF